jgi:hypothetical protein
LLQSKLRVGWTVGALVGGLVGRAVGGEEGEEEGVEHGSDDGRKRASKKATTRARGGHGRRQGGGRRRRRRSRNHGLLGRHGRESCLRRRRSCSLIIIVILRAGHFIMLCILQLPLPPLPRRLLEVCSSLRTAFDWGSTKRGGGGIHDEDVGAETAGAFLLSKEDNARSSARSEQKVRRIMARFEAGSEEKLPS